MVTVALVGGTHGNELTGIKLVEKWLNNPDACRMENLTIRPILANPAAIDKNVRYVDEDLNRAFSVDALNAPAGETHESQRAHELNALLGPKFADPKADVLLDLHTTTSNMGNTIIVYNKPFNLKMAKYIQDRLDNVAIYVSDKEMRETVGLQSIAPHGMLVEVGPVPQGVLFHEQFETMERIVLLALEFIQAYHASPEFDVTGRLDAYRRGTLVPYPTDDAGKITAMLHKDIQNRDYSLLQTGDPLFVTFDGEVIAYEGEPGYPVFVNEAAYYEKNMALRLNTKIALDIPGRNALTSPGVPA